MKIFTEKTEMISYDDIDARRMYIIGKTIQGTVFIVNRDDSVLSVLSGLSLDVFTESFVEDDCECVEAFKYEEEAREFLKTLL